MRASARAPRVRDSLRWFRDPCAVFQGLLMDVLVSLMGPRVFEALRLE